MKVLFLVVLLSTAALALPHDVLVSGAKTRQSLQLDGGNLTVTGSNNVVNLKGKVGRINISGSKNKVKCPGPFSLLLLSGSDNDFRWKDRSALKPSECVVSGSGNTILPPLPRGVASVNTVDIAGKRFPALYVALGACLLGVALTALKAVLFPSMERRLKADAARLERLWCRGAFGILCDHCQDYGYLPAYQVKAMLGRDWKIETLARLEERVAELEAPDARAWDLVRAMLLSRSAAAVRWWTRDQSWNRCIRQARMLQERYPGWAPMANELLRDRRAWRQIDPDGHDDFLDAGMKQVNAQRARMESEVWPRAPWGSQFKDA